jgi:hypothetical protein
VASFVLHIRQLRLRNEFLPAAIGNMDETPCWMDMPGPTTIESTGSRSVPLRTTGHDKARFTVVLAAMADGRKLKPYVIFKGVRRSQELDRIPGVVVALSRNGWMTEDLIADWLERVWGRIAFTQCLSVWDAYRCHITQRVKQAVQSMRTTMSVIPGGLTSLVQPADVCWNKPYKEAYREQYDEWLSSGEKSYTAGGHMRCADKATVIGWVKQAWASISPDVIRSSFTVCGIATNTDGSEDDLISCCKPGAPASEALPLIKQGGAIEGEIHSDDEEHEENETVVYE